jgi:hypothetical protein
MDWATVVHISKRNPFPGRSQRRCPGAHNCPAAECWRHEGPALCVQLLSPLSVGASAVLSRRLKVDVGAPHGSTRPCADRRPGCASDLIPRLRRPRRPPVEQPVADGQTPNQDGSGTIEAVGQGADPALLGERVWIWEAAWRCPFGTAAEYNGIPACQSVLLGAEPSFEVGAALGIQFLTAHRCLTVGESLPDRMSRGSLDRHTVLGLSAAARRPGGTLPVVGCRSRPRFALRRDGTTEEAPHSD